LIDFWYAWIGGIGIVSLCYTFLIRCRPCCIYHIRYSFNRTQKERRAWSVYVEIRNEHVRSIELNENAVATTTKAANGRDKLSCT